MKDPIPLWVGLALGFGMVLALAAVHYLAVFLPRRVMRLVLEERAATDHARAEKTALKDVTAVEVAGIVRELRAHRDEIASRARAARDITTAAAAEEVTGIVRHLRALVEWLQGFADARYAQAVPDREATTRRPGPAPASHAHPSSRASASVPPVSVPAPSCDPAQRAAGLARPNAASATKSGPPRPPPRSSDAPSATSTRVGLGPPDRDSGDSGAWIGLGASLNEVEANLEVPKDVEDRVVGKVLAERAARASGNAALPMPPPARRSLGSAPTLVSMVAVAEPSPRSVRPVAIEAGSQTGEE